jgi:hypothetical protein
MGIMDRIHAKIELFRLEQRYTRRRNRRSTFVSNAIYVDGEYIYQTPASTGSTTNTAASSSAASPTTSTSGSNSGAASPVDRPGKYLNRFSSMPGFGSLSKATGSRSPAAEWPERRASFQDSR